jgi:hypothetical protein
MDRREFFATAAAATASFPIIGKHAQMKAANCRIEKMVFTDNGCWVYSYDPPPDDMAGFPHGCVWVHLGDEP